MDAELYKLTLDVISDAIKILGPALITGLLVYKQSKAQLKLKLKELDKNNEFKAREKIFDFHKEKLKEVQSSIESLSGELGQFAGMSAADQNDELKFNHFINRNIANNIANLPFEIDHVYKELVVYEDDFPREIIRLNEELEKAKSLTKPSSPHEVQSTITDLLSIYGFLAHCVRGIIEKDAMQTFKPYIKNV